MVGELRALRHKDISPEIVWQAVRKAIDAGDIKDIYVITVKDNATAVYASGDLNTIGLALVALQSTISSYITDQIRQELPNE